MRLGIYLSCWKLLNKVSSDICPLDIALLTDILCLKEMMSMANETTTTASGGSSLLLVAFIVLKLTGVIGWSWWWVLSPLWIPIALVVVVLIIAAIIGLFS